MFPRRWQLGLGLALLCPAPVAAQLPAELPSLPPVVAPRSQEPVALDVEEAVRMAVAGSPRQTAALARVRAALAEAEVAASPARLRAALNGRTEYLQYPGGPPRRVIVDGVEQTQRPETFAFFQAYGALGVRQLVLDGGRIMAQVEALQATAGEQEAQAAADLQELSLEVRNAFMDTLDARQRVSTAEAAVAVAGEHVRVARLRFEAGKVPRGDVLQAEAAESAVRLELLRRQDAAATAEEALTALLGLPLDASLTLTPPAVPASPAHDLPACMAQARSDRPTLRVARMRLLAAERSVTAAEREDNAQVEAYADVGGYGFNEGVGSLGYNVGLQYSWPFLDGTRSAWMRERASARVEEARARLVQEERRVEAEVRGAWRAVELAAATYVQAQRRVAQSKENLRIVEGQYGAGRVGFPPMREAALDLERARTEQAGAYYDYLRARARLDFACGRP